MTQKQIVKTVCNLCGGRCGLLVEVQQGEPVKITGDPDCSASGGKLCIKGRASIEYVLHPDRLKFPLKRVGAKGEGEWQRISWKEALDTVAGAFDDVKKKCGATSVAMVHGSAKGYRDSYLARFANLFGTPNVAWQGHVCAVPRQQAKLITYGFGSRPDYEYPPSSIMVWGSNPAETALPEYRRLAGAVKKGARLIVIDPIKTGIAHKAEQWLRIKPGADLALALGMIHIIIAEELYDKAFVDQWTSGFDQLVEKIRHYTPENVAKITWINKDDLLTATRIFATSRPAAILSGNGVETNEDSFQTERAISIIRAITGNIGVPGGEIQRIPPPILRRKGPDLELWDKLPEEIFSRRLGDKKGQIPSLRYIPPENIFKAIIEEKPYPVKAVYMHACNALLTQANAKYVYDALTKLGFMVVSDLFMTPTAAMADIVLPASGYLEHNDILVGKNLDAQRKIVQVGESRSDYEIISALARKLNMGEHFWESEEACLNAILEPSGITFEELAAMGSLSGRKLYRTHEKKGFNTPSGKVEIFSEKLASWGIDPIPEFPDFNDAVKAEPFENHRFPFLLTSLKPVHFKHSRLRHLESIRRIYPDPIVRIHPATALDLNIEKNDWVNIETNQGCIKQKVKLSEDLDPRVVNTDYGWWFPEKGAGSFYDWKASNLNILTDNDPTTNPMGSTNLRGIPCRVYRES